MDFFSTAKARLVAMRTLLEDTVAGDRQRVSEQQTIAMTTLVAKLPSNDQQAAEAFAAEALALVHGMNHLLRMEDSDAIILALADLAATKKSKKWTMQNYQTVLSFCAETEWREAPLELASRLAILRFIFRKAYKLGCRRPAENTTKWWTSCALASTEGIAKVEQWPYSKLGDMHTDTKKEWKAFTERAGKDTLPQEQRLDCLPADKDDFRERHPVWYGELWPTEEPAICLLKLDEAVQIGQLYGCRGNGGKGKSGRNEQLLALEATASSSLATEPSTLAVIGQLQRNQGELQRNQIEIMKLLKPVPSSCLALEDHYESPCESPTASPLARSGSEESIAKRPCLKNRDFAGESARDRSAAQQPESVLEMLESRSQEDKARRAAAKAAEAPLAAADATRAKKDQAPIVTKLQRKPAQLKRPAAAQSIMLVPCDGLPKGWTCYTRPPRPDKYYTDPSGNQYRTWKAVEAVLKKGKKGTPRLILKKSA